jgi:hypothetical protein
MRDFPASIFMYISHATQNLTTFDAFARMLALDGFVIQVAIQSPKLAFRAILEFPQIMFDDNDISVIP